MIQQNIQPLKWTLFVLIASLSCLSFFSYAKNPKSDSSIINIDKRNQLVLNAKNKGKSLREDLQIVFQKHGVTLDDDIWKQIRAIVNSDLEKDTIIYVIQGNKNVKIGFKNGGGVLSDKDSIVRKTTKDSSNQEHSERVFVSQDGHISMGNVRIDPDGTVDVGNIHINSNGMIKVHKKDSSIHFASRAGFNIYVGLNTFGGTSAIGGSFNPSDFELNALGSRYFGIGVVRSATLSQSALKSIRLSYGLEMAWSNYMFDNNMVLTKGSNTLSFYTYLDDTGKSVTLSRNKLTIGSLILPIMPYIAFKKSKFLQFIGLGGYLGYRIDSYTKTKEDETGYKQWNHNSFFLNPVRYGLSFELGLKSLPVLFFNYDLSNIFQNDRGPKINGINFGIRM